MSKGGGGRRNHFLYNRVAPTFKLMTKFPLGCQSGGVAWYLMINEDPTRTQQFQQTIKTSLLYP